MTTEQKGVDAVIYLTDAERVEAIKTLEIARARIVAGLDCFICIALPWTAIGHKLRDGIKQALKGSYSFQSYYSASGIETTARQRMDARIQWLTNWIDSLKGQP